jgi:hypothetical protein
MLKYPHGGLVGPPSPWRWTQNVSSKHQQQRPCSWHADSHGLNSQQQLSTMEAYSQISHTLTDAWRVVVPTEADNTNCLLQLSQTYSAQLYDHRLSADRQSINAVMTSLWKLTKKTRITVGPPINVSNAVHDLLRASSTNKDKSIFITICLICHVR